MYSLIPYLFCLATLIIVIFTFMPSFRPNCIYLSLYSGFAEFTLCFVKNDGGQFFKERIFRLWFRCCRRMLILIWWIDASLNTNVLFFSILARMIFYAENLLDLIAVNTSTNKSIAAMRFY